MSQQKLNITFGILLLLDFILLLFVSDSLSISHKEVDIYYADGRNILWYLTHLSTEIFGNNNIALRLPFVLFYISSVILAYALTDDYFSRPIDRFISICIFMLLPGLNSAALVLDSSIIVVFCTLLYLYLFKRFGKEYYILLVLFLFIDNSFAILFLALFFYSLQKKDNTLLIISLLLFGISMQMYGFEIGGRPRGYFIETFGIYASIFSPILFLFFFYTLYRVGLKGERDLYWYIAFTSLGLSLLFSLRQKVDVADFAPFVVIAIPLMVKLFLHSFRIRLKIFRRYHYTFAKVMLSILILNLFVLLFNKPLYLVLQKNDKHFAYKYHGIYELSQELKELHILSVTCQNEKLQKQLEFYGVSKGNKYYLTIYKKDNYHDKIDIKYYDKLIKSYYLLLLK
ncbi:MAG TPA: hypothetical protein EYG97_00330 [Arcobacter sp.]|nr:hypothetical protein [Arcobacter sp.]HIP55454.1 hypothetical protein [Arcobacter sp.]